MLIGDGRVLRSYFVQEHCRSWGFVQPEALAKL
jgi:hypothetical protein